MTSTKMLVENSLRAGWKTGAACQIYSNSKKKWFSGEVAQIFTDEEGEWLEVRYDKSMSKQVQRYSSDIRPHVCVLTVFSAKSHTIHQKHNIHSQTTSNQNEKKRKKQWIVNHSTTRRWRYLNRLSLCRSLPHTNISKTCFLPIHSSSLYVPSTTTQRLLQRRWLKTHSVRNGRRALLVKSTPVQSRSGAAAKLLRYSQTKRASGLKSDTVNQWANKSNDILPIYAHMFVNSPQNRTQFIKNTIYTARRPQTVLSNSAIFN